MEEGSPAGTDTLRHPVGLGEIFRRRKNVEPRGPARLLERALAERIGGFLQQKLLLQAPSFVSIVCCDLHFRPQETNVLSVLLPPQPPCLHPAPTASLGP